MTGPEHYTEAELLLHRIGHCTNDTPADKTLLVALAQAHATLALAAATVVPSVNAWYGDESHSERDWAKAVAS
jgi:hypothetical protein